MLHREHEVRKYHTSSAADLLQETMEYHKITQTDLAERLGTSQKRVSEILRRKSFIDETLALRIEQVMGISSILLLNLDSNYKLHLAKAEQKNLSVNQNSDKFLKRYDWVTI